MHIDVLFTYDKRTVQKKQNFKSLSSVNCMYTLRAMKWVNYTRTKFPKL